MCCADAASPLLTHSVTAHHVPALTVPQQASACHDVTTQVSMHADMGLNMLRLWGGCGATRTPLLDACDELGLLVWWEFWVTGDCQGRGSTPVECARWWLQRERCMCVCLCLCVCMGDMGASSLRMHDVSMASRPSTLQQEGCQLVCLHGKCSSYA